MKLFPFEFKKMVYSKKFLVLLLAVVGAVVALFIHNVVFQPVIKEDQLQVADERWSTSEMMLRGHQYKLEDDPNNETELALEKMMYENMNILAELKGAVRADDWQAQLTKENAFFKSVVTYNEAGGEYPLAASEIVRKYAMNQKLLDENIKPEHDVYSLAFPNFMKQVFEFFFQFGAMIIMFILIGDLMTAEFEDHSAKLLFTQPLKRMNIITSKLWTAICSYVLIIAVIWLAVFVIGGVFGDKGTFDYPVLIEQNGELAFIATADYILYGLISISVMIVGMISLYLLLGLFFKQTIATLFVLAVIMVGGYGGASLISWDFFAWLNPFRYVFPTDPILHQNGTAWYQGLPVVLVLSLLFYGLAVKKISKSRIA